MDHGIIAINDCSIAHVETGAIEETIGSNARIARAMWWATLVDEAVLRSWIVNQSRRDAKQRIAHLLCELHVRMRMIGLAPGEHFNLLLIQEEIADAVGLTSVHTNRMLQELRAADVIAFESHTLTILNLDGLRAIAEFDPNYLHLVPR